MSAEEILDDAAREKSRFHFDRHTPEYRHQFVAVTQELQAKCPIAWSDTYDGHWVASGNREVFELARSAEYLSNDHDVNNERRGYKGFGAANAPIRLAAQARLVRGSVVP